MLQHGGMRSSDLDYRKRAVTMAFAADDQKLQGL